MLAPRTYNALRSVAAPIIGVLIVLSLPHPSGAQQSAVSAELKGVVGRVEILRKGQTQWVPAVVGAHLVEGDDVQAFSGASAELVLPDTSTVVLAENSRLLLTKLEFDRQNQTRVVLLHLAVGKARAAIAPASVASVRPGESNFAISTPTAVAAARGTIVWVFTHGQNSLVAVEPEAGVSRPSRVDCISLRGVPAGGPLKGQTIFAGSMATDCGAPTPIQRPFLTLNNAVTANAPALAGAPVVVPARALEAVRVNPTASSPAAVPGVSSNTTGAPRPATSPTSTGQDIQQNQQQGQNQQDNYQEMSAGQNQHGNNQNQHGNNQNQHGNNQNQYGNNQNQYGNNR